MVNAEQELIVDFEEIQEALAELAYWEDHVLELPDHVREQIAEVAEHDEVAEVSQHSRGFDVFATPKTRALIANLRAARRNAR